ncbi:MAG TPA: transposase [Tichowtungia sp.]|nr:transposase [Tichowtungia sp.]
MKDRKHLKRIGTVWDNHPRYFITTCTRKRQQVLASSQIHEILRAHWVKSFDLYGWAIGSYVIMPDHVHFFCTDAGGTTSLSKMIGAWKQWSSKELCSTLNIQAPVWQKEFFDHLLRSNESYSEKWNYVRCNPVRAGLVGNADDWAFSGYIDYA